jgi:hypothetical protein
MIVAELIERLQAEDPNANVHIDTSDAERHEVLLDIQSIDGDPLNVYIEAS